jgi:hypothetical protein
MVDSSQFETTQITYLYTNDVQSTNAQCIARKKSHKTFYNPAYNPSSRTTKRSASSFISHHITHGK